MSTGPIGGSSEYEPPFPKDETTKYISIRSGSGFQRVECKEDLSAIDKITNLAQSYLGSPTWVRTQVRTLSNGRITLKAVYLKKTKQFNPCVKTKYSSLNTGLDEIAGSIRLPYDMSKPRQASQNDPLILLYIARQKKHFGSRWDSSQLRTLVKQTAIQSFIETGGRGTDSDPLMIEPDDIKYYIAFISQHFNDTLSPDISAYYRQAIKQKDIILRKLDSEVHNYEIKTLGAFCGLKGTVNGVNLELYFTTLILPEIAHELAHFQYLEELDRREIEEAFHVEASGVNPITISRIHDGKMVIFPLDFFDEKKGHAVSIVFYKNHFAICNRGLRLISETVKLYTYDPSRLNLEMLQWLVLQKEGAPTLEEQQHTHLYEIFPKLLKATEVTGEMPSPDEGVYQVVSAKDQSVNNCTKASPMTAFKVGVYLKTLEKLPSDDPNRFKKAAAHAKRLSSALSFRLRMSAIRRAERFAVSSSSSLERETQILTHCNEAKKKLGKGVLGKVIADKEFREMYEGVKDSADDTIRKHVSPYADPILLFIAVQRKALGSDWKPELLQNCPVDKGTCRSHIESLNTSGEEITVTELDEQLYAQISEHSMIL